MNYKQKVVILLHNNFRLFGIGHFDLNYEDIIELLKALDSENPNKEVKELYERLEKERMG